MIWIAIAALAVYAALKGAQLAFLGRASGYRAAPIPLADRLRKGEPALSIVAILITVGPGSAILWYHHHKFETVLRDSAACYGLIQAYRHAPEIHRTNSEHAVYEAVYALKSVAIDASRQLGLDRDVAKRRLDQAAGSVATGNGGGIRHDRLAATQRCLHPPEDAPNA